MRGFFVTGTGTDVGKTVVSAALMMRLRRHEPVRYWKPIQTGIELPLNGGNDTAEVARIAGCAASELHDFGVRLPGPVSPHLAAQRTGKRINVQEIALLGNPPDEYCWIVEGAGGLLVPVNPDETMTALVRKLKLPLIIAAHSGLGTINHTLLTLEAARMRSFAIAGVVMVGEPNAANRTAIAHYGEMEPEDIHQMPQFDPFTPGAVEDWAVRDFDPDGQLLRWLR